MISQKKKSVLFILPAPLGISPGQRFRLEHYLSHLRKEGFKCTFSSFYGEKGWKTIYTPGNKIRKIFIVLSGFFRRMLDIFRVSFYSYVFVYREAAPVGPPFFEWIFCKVFRKKMIYDFDDAIWIPVTSEYNQSVSGIKNFSKISSICRWSYRVSVGNEFLAQYVRRFNQDIAIIPTVVDTDKVHNTLQKQDSENPAVGWTGTFSTLHYLDMVIPVLNRLQTIYDFSFIVIADKDPRLPVKNYKFIKWKKETEVDDLLNFHIRLMPLFNDDISKGKCGFKAIQYMSLGIPAIVSPVGVNSKIVDNGINGFICDTGNDWFEKLQLLLSNPNLRVKMGKEARNKIQAHYSVRATTDAFRQLFN